MTPSQYGNYPYDIPASVIPGAFTYDFGSNPAISNVRLLIADTQPGPSPFPLFNDAEIMQALYLESAQNLYVSGMATQGGQNAVVPVQIYSYYRAAALLLDALAANNSLLSSIQKLLDVELAPGKAAQELRATAAEYRKTEANAGHWAIAELVHDQFSARERVWKQLLRLYGG